MKRIAALMIVAVLAAMSMTACNTVRGVGQDVSAAGDKVADKAQDCKDMKC